MTQKRILKTILNFILTGALLASLSSLAFAAPPAQSGGQGSGTNQEEMNQGVGNNQDANNQSTGATASGSATVNNNNNSMFNQTLTDNPDKGLLVVENLSGSDIVFDLTQPEPGTAWVGPNEREQFLLSPGQHQYTGHHPTGEFGIAGEQFEVTAGQVTWLACFRNQCQLAQSSMLPGQGQTQQQPAGTTVSGANANDSTTTGVNTAGTATATSGVTNANNAVFSQMLEDNPDKGLLIVENLSGSDIVFDLTQPEPGTAWVGPNEQKEFLLTPGQHQYSGHEPVGDFAIGANQVQVRPGQITWLSCFRNLCQLAQSSMLPGQGQSGQMQPQPGQIQQQSGGSQSGNNSGNDNNNNQ